MKILLIEDNDRDIQVFTTSAKAWKAENPDMTESIDVKPCKTLGAALSLTDSQANWDGIVLDLKLTQDTDGEVFLKHLKELYLRIPVVVLSGTPWELDDEYKSTCLKSYVKAEQHEKEILDLLWDCKRTGLMNLIGGKGIFEQHLKTVFDKCISPRFEEWRELLKTVGGNNAEDTTSAALTRHILACLGFIFSNEAEKIQPEECYIPLPNAPDTYKYPVPGMIVKNGDDAKWLVLNPACDLELRTIKKKREDGSTEERIAPKTEYVFLVSIEPISSIIASKNTGERKKLYANNSDLNVHWLPCVKSFDGGFVDFRKVKAIPCAGFFDEYRLLVTPMVIHPDVLKNIQSRFANYYARQGQPDIAYDRFC